MRRCDIKGCSSEHAAKGFCSLHYNRKKAGWPDYRLTAPAGRYAQGRSHLDSVHSSRAVKQASILWYKMARPCMDCGYSNYRALELDHVRGEKAFCIGEAKDKPLLTILQELQKCDVVCANCHRIRTIKRVAPTFFTILGL